MNFEIPNNATNKDVITKLFPNFEILNEVKDVCEIALDKDNAMSPNLKSFKSWLNAPYNT